MHDNGINRVAPAINLDKGYNVALIVELLLIDETVAANDQQARDQTLHRQRIWEALRVLNGLLEFPHCDVEERIAQACEFEAGIMAAMEARGYGIHQAVAS